MLEIMGNVKTGGRIDVRTRQARLTPAAGFDILGSGLIFSANF
jgi:hypothetical protein